jgi:hypothetical protein
MSGPVIDDYRKPAGYGQDADFATASALPDLATALTNKARAALIQAEGDSLRWRDDGTDPTTSVGMLLSVGESFLYVGDLNTIKIIESSTSSVINVSYYV